MDKATASGAVDAGSSPAGRVCWSLILESRYEKTEDYDFGYRW